MINKPCECGSLKCTLSVQVSDEVAVEINHRQLIVIVEGCKTGAMGSDTFVEPGKGYSLYRENEAKFH